jgi:predicted small integral membrane protein
MAMILRGAKVLFVGGVGLLALLIGLDDLFDYETNFAAVRHILAMDTIPPTSPLLWRAIHNEAAHHLGYAFIIATELCASALCFIGVARLARARNESGRAFNHAKGVAILGLVVALSLYFVGFMVIGGEWFQMWRSEGWNMQEPAFRFVGTLGIVLLFLTQRDEDLTDGD